MAENGRFSELSCHATPAGTSFKASNHSPDGTTVRVTGTESSDGTIKGDWRVIEHGRTAAHVAPNGAVQGHAGINPEIARDNAKSILNKTAGACRAGLDLRLF
jgi:hypothetical protein